MMKSLFLIGLFASCLSLGATPERNICNELFNPTRESGFEQVPIRRFIAEELDSKGFMRPIDDLAVSTRIRLRYPSAPEQVISKNSAGILLKMQNAFQLVVYSGSKSGVKVLAVVTLPRLARLKKMGSMENLLEDMIIQESGHPFPYEWSTEMSALDETMTYLSRRTQWGGPETQSQEIKTAIGFLLRDSHSTHPTIVNLTLHQFRIRKGVKETLLYLSVVPITPIVLK